MSRIWGPMQTGTCSIAWPQLFSCFHFIMIVHFIRLLLTLRDVPQLMDIYECLATATWNKLLLGQLFETSQMLAPLKVISFNWRSWAMDMCESVRDVTSVSWLCDMWWVRINKERFSSILHTSREFLIYYNHSVNYITQTLKHLSLVCKALM